MRIPRPRPRSSLARRLSFTASLAVALIIGLVLVVYLLPRTHAQNEPITTRTAREKGTEFVPGELLVRFKRGSAGARVKTRTALNIRASTGQTINVDVNHFGGSEIVEGLMLARVSADDTFTALTALRAHSDVEYAEPNFIRHADAVPNDLRYSDLWALKDAAPDGPGISAESAWSTTTGNHNVVVGVVDSGIDIQHHDLKDNIFVNTGEIPNNNIDDDNNGYIDDVNGWDFLNHDRIVFDSAAEDAHGTHVAGTIGARGNNSAGIVGVNWDVQLMPLKAIGFQGTTDATLLEVFNYVKMMRQRGVNLRILNNSYGGQRFSQSLLEAIKQLGDAGILFVAAAGNSTLNNDFVSHFPASYDLPNVISVAASGQGGFFSSGFSNRGLQTVHLAAPGENILSTTPRGYTGGGLAPGYTEPDGSTYSRFNGTSMATPHVSGAAALALAANPDITLEKLRAAVLFSVDQSFQFTNLVLTGGRLNANKAVQAALENDTTPPATAGNFRINSQEGRRVELHWIEPGDDGTTGRASLSEIRFTDSLSGKQFRLNSLRAAEPGTERTVFVSVPLKHSTGQLSLRTFDNVGNTSSVTANVTVAPDVADPYIVSVGSPGTLTPQNSGTPVGPKGDDALSGVPLSFPFPFFGFTTTGVTVSSNGAIYVPIPPEFALPQPSFGFFDFAVATRSNLEGMAMIAGMWADLRTDRNTAHNVYMVKPDPDRVIFRWQGVTFGTETPVNFEIELRRDGTIQTRYGDGNQNLRPVIVGISGGDPDVYIVDSHSSETNAINLSNAQSVTFALRNPPPPPTTDLAVSMTATPIPVVSGQNLTYNIRVRNLGPDVASDLVMTNVLPTGTTFVSCTTDHFILGACDGPPTTPPRTVIGTLEALLPSSTINFTIVAKVDAAPGAALQNTASATSFRQDPDPSNNSATVISYVVAETFFGNARAIAAGNSHTTSVRTDGSVWTWGRGDVGQLGNGTSGPGMAALTPVQVSGLTGVEAVVEGFASVYALKSDGTVWAWGANGAGQLGDGTTTDRSLPVQTAGLTNVKQVAAGAFYGVALKQDGTIWVWGGTQSLTNDFQNLTPRQLTGIGSVTAIAAGITHLLMLKSDKTLWAIGSNSFGQLGDGTITSRQSPVQVTGLSNVARIAAGNGFSVALKNDGTVWGWGRSFDGELGPAGSNTGTNPNPIQVTGLPAEITNISAGADFCFALVSDGTVWAWGRNSDGQLGQGSVTSHNATPQQIPNFANVAAVAGGGNHSVALKTDGSVWCWGGNFSGQCGDASTDIRVTPTRVSGLQSVSTPVFNPASGSFEGSVDVTVTCATPGATIHYRTDFGEPTESDPIVASGGTVRLTHSAFLRVRAFKPGFVPSTVRSESFHVQPLPPQLLLDDSGPAADQLAALDSVLLLRDPFPVINQANQLKKAGDPNTRVILFVRRLQLAPGETASSLIIQLIDASNNVRHVLAEDVRTLPAVDFVQVVFRLPDGLAPGTCQIQLFAHSVSSNVGTFRIKP